MTPDLNDPKWTEYLLGDLTGEELQSAETLLEQNPDLREELNALRATLELTQQALLEPVTGEEDIADACRAALDRPPNRRPILFILPTAIAAGLALFLGLNVFLNRDAAPGVLVDETGAEHLDLFMEDLIAPFGLDAETAPETTKELPTLRESIVLERRFQPAADSAEPPPPAPARARSLQMAPLPEEDAFMARGAVMGLRAEPESEPDEEDEDEEDEDEEDKEEKDEACQPEDVD
jgi:hypothetical protein